MEKRALFLFAVTALITLLQSQYTLLFCYSQTTLHQNSTNITDDHELSALLAFKSRLITSDRPNTLTNWSITTTTTPNICRWIGITCNANHRITALNLSNQNLVGTISPNLGNLTFLTSLDLSFNRFTGVVPFELSNLRGLREMNLGYNSLTGNLPSFFSSLSDLRVIVLSNNSFTGVLPPMYNLSKLEVLQISYNSVQGNIPESIGNLTALRNLDLKYNKLSGTIPFGILNVSSLERVDLSYNSLSGEIPVDLCDNSNNVPRLIELVLSTNQFVGKFPANLGKCRALQHLSLSVNQFSGSVPREIGELKILRYLYLGANNLQGGIPSEIGNLSKLEEFSMRQTSLSGQIPLFIFNMSSLTYIDLSNNNLSGTLVPMDINVVINLPNLEQLFLHSNRLTGQVLSSLLNCKKLLLLQLSSNQFTGVVPKQVGNFTLLKILFLHRNNMTGEIPFELGKLNNLERLALATNDFSGSIPLSIFNISTLIELELSSNNFHGQLPTKMGQSLPNLERLHLNSNTLSGPIPTSITNSSKLSIISMGINSFTGPIPNFGSLERLQRLAIGANNLTGESHNQELRFISSLSNCRHLEMLELSFNPLNGILPRSLGNLSTSLQNFRAFGCGIMGSIPDGIGNLVGLEAIVLDSNKLTGLIPATLGKLTRVEVIYLEHNRLQGPIPVDLCNITRLWDLYLSGNMLNGSIPSCFGELKSLKNLFLDSNNFTSVVPNLWKLTDIGGLNLSTNLLSGSISSDIENLKSLRDLDLSWNRFSGNIPASIGSIDSLERLSFAHNGFHGTIPQSFGGLRGLQLLDLSHNNLSGTIPKSLEALRNLQRFNVSYNRLEGEIPAGGPFPNFTSLSFMQNNALCGAVRLEFPPCQVQRVRRSISKRLSIIMYIMIALITSLILAVGIIIYLVRKRRAKKESQPEISPLVAWRRVSYNELLQATEDFSEINALGSGSFGSVFKGKLSDGLDIAVKVFNLETERSAKSFDVECEVMSTVRHRNLVRVISCCSNDVDFKALVLEYMPNGSLEKWLYSHNYCLDLMQRLNIAIDVALALEYLHHGNEFQVVHCDLKPSNVLLNEDMTARVGDFGIAKLFGEGVVVHQTITLATIGYMAPEYGSEGIVSTSCDVYSYGIMVLEMLTRKRPTDEMFGGEVSLKQWVSEALQENRTVEVVATGLLAREDQHFTAKEKCIFSIFELALQCLDTSPELRINMVEAVVILKKIRAAFIASTTRPHRRTLASRRAIPDSS